VTRVEVSSPSAVGARLLRVQSYDPLRLELEELVGAMCKALNDPKRLFIISLLGEQPRTVGELVELMGSPQANVSQHLAILRERGIVESRKDGSSVEYSLRHPKVLEAISILREILSDEVERRGSLVARD